MRNPLKMVYKSNWFFVVFLLMLGITAQAQEDRGKKLIGIAGDKFLFDDGTDRHMPSLKFDEVRLFIFVRHAEKDTIGFDPGLSDEGNARADRLVRIFGPLPLEAIFATPFRRTKLTAFPIARAKDVEVIQYDQGHLDHFIEEVLWPGTGNMLIVGHSNTTPLLLNKILKEDRFDMIPESEYQHIFFIEKYPNGQLKVYQYSF